MIRLAVGISLLIGMAGTAVQQVHAEVDLAAVAIHLVAIPPQGFAPQAAAAV